jgi:hypothetical protein
VNNHNQDARVYGDNNVVGHGNTITRNEIHNHKQSGGSGGVMTRIKAQMVKRALVLSLP